MKKYNNSHYFLSSETDALFSASISSLLGSEFFTTVSVFFSESLLCDWMPATSKKRHQPRNGIRAHICQDDFGRPGNSQVGQTEKKCLLFAILSFPNTARVFASPFA